MSSLDRPSARKTLAYKLYPRIRVAVAVPIRLTISANMCSRVFTSSTRVSRCTYTYELVGTRAPQKPYIFDRWTDGGARQVAARRAFSVILFIFRHALASPTEYIYTGNFESWIRAQYPRKGFETTISNVSTLSLSRPIHCSR